jgi:cytochrome c-type biogenesis protein CcmH/NrfG
MKLRGFAALCVILLFSSFLPAQNRGATAASAISGKVVIPDAHFQDQFEVLLIQNAEQVVQATVADNQGRYRFTRLGNGTYYVVVKIEGFEDVRHRVDIFLPGEVIANIIMDFKEERIIRPPEDFSGEDVEVVDLSELERNYPSKLLDEVKSADKDVRAGNYQRATLRLEAVIQEAPDLYFAHKLLGSAYQKLNRIRDAESAFKTAADLRPASAAPHLSLGSLYLQEAEASSGQGSSVVRTILNEALGSLNAAIKLKQDAAFAYYLRGVTYYRTTFYEDAEDDLKKAIEISPNLLAARLGLANVYIKMQEWPNAIVQLDAYLTADPKSESRAEVERIRARLLQRSKGPQAQVR